MPFLTPPFPFMPMVPALTNPYQPMAPIFPMPMTPFPFIAMPSMALSMALGAPTLNYTPTTVGQTLPTLIAGGSITQSKKDPHSFQPTSMVSSSVMSLNSSSIVDQRPKTKLLQSPKPCRCGSTRHGRTRDKKCILLRTLLNAQFYMSESTQKNWYGVVFSKAKDAPVVTEDPLEAFYQQGAVYDEKGKILYEPKDPKLKDPKFASIMEQFKKYRTKKVIL